MLECTRTDAEAIIEDAERSVVNSEPDRAIPKFRLGLSILAELNVVARRTRALGGGAAGFAALELWTHSFWLGVLGAAGGALAGRAIGETYAQDLAPLYVRAHRGLGDAYRASGDIAKAREHYVLAIHAAPQDSLTLDRLATAR